MRPTLATLALPAVMVSAGCSFPVDSMSSWVDEQELNSKEASSAWRFVPVDLRAEAPPRVSRREHELITIEPPAHTPAYLLVYVYTDTGPDEAWPALEMTIGAHPVWLVAAEYAWARPHLHAYPAPMQRVDPAELDGMALKREGCHQFRFGLFLSTPEPVTFRVDMWRGDQRRDHEQTSAPLLEEH